MRDEFIWLSIALVGTGLGFLVGASGGNTTKQPDRAAFQTGQCEALSGVPVLIKGRVVCLSSKMLIELPGR